MNYYELLQVDQSASVDVIKASYKALAKKYHPDIYNDGGAMMEKINIAFDILSDSNKRKEYDYTLKKRDDDLQNVKDNENAKEQNLKSCSEHNCNINNRITPLSIIISLLYVLIQGIGYVLQIVWGLVIILIIIGFFTGHSQMLFRNIMDWILNLIG